MMSAASSSTSWTSVTPYQLSSPIETSNEFTREGGTPPAAPGAERSHSERTSSEGSASELKIPPNSYPFTYHTSQPHKVPFSFMVCDIEKSKMPPSGVKDVHYQVYVVSEENFNLFKDKSIREIRLNPIDFLKTPHDAIAAIKANRLFIILREVTSSFPCCCFVQTMFDKSDWAEVNKIVFTNLSAKSDLTHMVEKTACGLLAKEARKIGSVQYDPKRYIPVDSEIYRTNDLWQAACLQVLANVGVSHEQMAEAKKQLEERDHLYAERLQRQDQENRKQAAEAEAQKMANDAYLLSHMMSSDIYYCPPKIDLQEAREVTYQKHGVQEKPADQCIIS